MVFILVSVFIFVSSSRLEDSLSDVEEIELEREHPVIIDTNYLIEDCRNSSEYKNILKFIKKRYDYGQPVIVPKSVYSEFKFGSKNPVEASRVKNLKEF